MGRKGACTKPKTGFKYLAASLLMMVCALGANFVMAQVIEVRVRDVDSKQGVQSRVVLLQADSNPLRVADTDRVGRASFEYTCQLGALVRAEPYDVNYFQSPEAVCKPKMDLLVEQRGSLASNFTVLEAAIADQAIYFTEVQNDGSSDRFVATLSNINVSESGSSDSFIFPTDSRNCIIRPTFEVRQLDAASAVNLWTFDEVLSQAANEQVETEAFFSTPCDEAINLYEASNVVGLDLLRVAEQLGEQISNSEIKIEQTLPGTSITTPSEGSTIPFFTQ